MKKKYLIINIILVLVLIIIGFSYYIIFYKNKKNNNYKETIENVYICDDYGTKMYSEKKINGYNCYKIDFSCNNCLIYGSYYENKIIYSSDNKEIIVYDLNNQKIIDTLKTEKNPWPEFYKQEYENYGFTYYDSDYNMFFYNLTNNKRISVDANMCGNVYYENFFKRCESSISKNIIVNHRVIVEKINETENGHTSYYGILNLKNGNYDIPINKGKITIDSYYTKNSDGDYYYKNYFIINEDNSIYNATVYDSELNLIYKFEEESETLSNLLIKTLKYYGDDKLLIYQDNYGYHSIINKNTGERYFKLYDNDVNSKIYNQIKNAELREKTDKDLIVSELEEGKDITYYYDLNKQIFYIFFNYRNNYYETDIYVNYKYDFKTNILESFENEEDNCEDCGEE